MDDIFSNKGMSRIGQKERATQNRAVKLFREKKGRMQELLTGRSRLVEPSSLRFAVPRSGRLRVEGGWETMEAR